MRIEHVVQIEARPEVLWHLLIDPEQMKRWMPDIVDQQIVSGEASQVGCRSRVQIREGSRIVEYTSEIRVFEAPEDLQVQLRGGSLGKGPMDVSYRLSATENATTVAYTAQWQPFGLNLRLLSPLIAMVAKRNASTAFARLRRLAESPPA